MHTRVRMSRALPSPPPCAHTRVHRGPHVRAHLQTCKKACTNTRVCEHARTWKRTCSCGHLQVCTCKHVQARTSKYEATQACNARAQHCTPRARRWGPPRPCEVRVTAVREPGGAGGAARRHTHSFQAGELRGNVTLGMAGSSFPAWPHGRGGTEPRGHPPLGTAPPLGTHARCGTPLSPPSRAQGRPPPWDTATTTVTQPTVPMALLPPPPPPRAPHPTQGHKAPR